MSLPERSTDLQTLAAGYLTKAQEYADKARTATAAVDRTYFENLESSYRLLAGLMVATEKETARIAASAEAKRRNR